MCEECNDSCHECPSGKVGIRGIHKDNLAVIEQALNRIINAPPTLEKHKTEDEGNKVYISFH